MQSPRDRCNVTVPCGGTISAENAPSRISSCSSSFRARGCLVPHCGCRTAGQMAVRNSQPDEHAVTPVKRMIFRQKAVKTNPVRETVLGSPQRNMIEINLWIGDPGPIIITPPSKVIRPKTKERIDMHMLDRLSKPINRTGLPLWPRVLDQSHLWRWYNTSIAWDPLPSATRKVCSKTLVKREFLWS